MAYYGQHPSLKRDSNPIDDDVWHWFICNGPHGENFCWHKELSTAPRDIDFLREIIEEKTKSDQGFMKKVKIIAREALSNDNPLLVCKAIQVLTVIGEDFDFTNIKVLTESPERSIAINARCCLFENGIKVKKNKT
jgi:hypothetical protein